MSKKLIPMEVVVSIPRAGEFIATVKLDADALSQRPLQLGDVVNQAVEQAMSRVIVKPLKGEAKRVSALIQKRERR